MAENGSLTRSRALIWWGLALVLMILGFWDLTRGGETLAPILLVASYVIVIPLAILRS